MWLLAGPPQRQRGPQLCLPVPCGPQLTTGSPEEGSASEPSRASGQDGPPGWGGEAAGFCSGHFIQYVMQLIHFLKPCADKESLCPATQALGPPPGAG